MPDKDFPAEACSLVKEWKRTVSFRTDVQGADLDTLCDAIALWGRALYAEGVERAAVMMDVRGYMAEQLRQLAARVREGRP